MARLMTSAEQIESVIESGPTDYEVWRDACNIASGESKGEWMDGDLLTRAKWWRRQLQRTADDLDTDPDDEEDDNDDHG